jgi:hypothetical protein
MSQAFSPGCACPVAITTETPGSPGSNGTNGYNAYSVLQNSFVVPAINSNVTVTVDQAAWESVGQNVFIPGAGNFSVASIASGTPPTSVTLTYLNYAGNTNAGATIASGVNISPSGTQPAALSTPVSIANGGTGASAKAGAQSGLGLGQNATVSNQSGLTQSMPTSATQVTNVGVTVPATGLYQVQGFATVDMQGMTIGTSAETITLRVQDTTSSTTLATATINLPIVTTLTFPSFDYITPPVTATLTLNDTLQLQVSMSQNHSGNPTAGTIKISSGGLIITPLALS